MRVLVTGASGFVGREIVRELDNSGHQIIKVVSAKSNGITRGQNTEDFFSLDIGDYANFSLIKKIEPVDAVIHAAGLAHQFKAIERARFDAVNVKGTENAARLAVELKARQFILISSTAVYGIRNTAKQARANLSETAITENAECRPETVYAESKLAAEKIAREFCENKKVALTILRLAPVLGEDGAGNAARLIEAIDAGRFLRLGAGENLKTLIYKKDVARACSLILLNKKPETEIFNLAGKPVKMSDFVEAIANALNRRIPNFELPVFLLEAIFQLNELTFGIKKIKNLGATLEKWLSDDVYSAAKIRHDYGFEPQTTTLEAVEKQVAAYLEKK